MEEVNLKTLNISTKMGCKSLNVFSGIWSLGLSSINVHYICCCSFVTGVVIWKGHIF